MRSETEVIILHETLIQSWARDASTLAMFAGLIGLGVYLDSAAMQWTGAVIGFIAIFSRAAGKAKRLSLGQARALLDEIERNRATD